MPPIFGTAFMPHPPILIPAIGKGEEKSAHKTLKGIDRIAGIVNEREPETIVVLTPHGQRQRQSVTVNVMKHLSGNLGTFGCSEVALTYANNLALINEMVAALQHEGYPLEQEIMSLDHGALVPLYFLSQSSKAHHQSVRLIHLTVSGDNYDELFQMGKIMGTALHSYESNILLLASGDLSHRLKSTGPYGYHPAGPVFDEKVVEAVAHNRLSDLLHLSNEVIQGAAQCGLGPFIMAAGMTNQLETDTSLFSYEGPFGVGYLCGMAIVREETVHPAVWLATKAIRCWLVEKRQVDLSQLCQDKRMVAHSPFWAEVRNSQAGAFVSLHHLGRLRGCIGTIYGTKECLGDEIIANAIQAATSDPRFPPVTMEEMERLEVKVDVLGEMETVTEGMELNVQKYGIMVESGYRRGLLLPALEGIGSVDQQLSIVLDKAGISREEPYVLKRFTVTRYQ